MGAAFDWIASVELMEMDMEPLLYDKEQTRYLLGIGASKLQELMANGQLTVVYIGRSARIIAESIHTYIVTFSPIVYSSRHERCSIASPIPMASRSRLET